ncbi:helix-turn-helix transcriptional regulator [Flavobacterium lacisediminis]|uniref:Helix-turn-helix domain-containing protein n=1 Tax=Flavobacterium lacisediminis TaxID=2989705 RepID=A0ABT3EHJ0_9FLAO|nr:helix-turn-helix domain-containing protein [Flavobacterium lacisediminis]MCW1148046.1 helix-turn-helix domain-containing protein [Flavobacterium lacisediminis]
MEGKLLNEDFLNSIIKSRVDSVLSDFVSELQKDLSANYYLDDSLLTKHEVAKKLNISIRQVDNLKNKGKLKSCLIGKSVRFRNSDVLNYIKSLS